jgi:cation diffusion facilitator CzcD-associated flavoprotein CzcO
LQFFYIQLSSNIEAQGRFKVLITGAGITGPTLAHYLEKADMDYTI